MIRVDHLIPSFSMLGPLLPVLVSAMMFATGRPKHAHDSDDISEGTRETQIIRYAALGLTDKEIAEKLNLSPNTIYTYWRRVRARYGSNSRGEAISRYLHDSFNHFRRIVDLFPDTILIVQHGRIGFASPAASALFDLSSTESALDQPVEKFIETEALPISDDRNLRFGTARTTGRAIGIRRPGGESVAAVLSCTPIEWRGKPAALAIVRELSPDLDVRGNLEGSVSDAGTLPDILLMLDRTGACLDYRPSPKAPAATDVLGRHYRDFLAAPVTIALDEALRKLEVRPSEVHISTGGSEIGRFVMRCSMLAQDRILVLVRIA